MSIKRHYLRKREIKEVISQFIDRIKVSDSMLLDRAKSVEIVKLGRADIYIFDGKPKIAKIKDKLIPTLLFEDAIHQLPTVTVDMGAIPHICNGADIMVPGIVKTKNLFSKGDIVVVVDEKNNKAVAIGEALMDSEELKNACRGKAIKNLHYVGDNIWKDMKKLKSGS